MMKTKLFSTVVLALPLALTLTGCTLADSMSNKYEASASKSAKTSEEGVSSGLLPQWVPAGGSNVKLEQRSTGHERIFIMDYAGQIPAECPAIDTVGQPTDEELAKAYASDPRTEDMDPQEFVTFRTLEADWWPEGTEEKTTNLCGRWWVHLNDSKLYAFAADVSSVAEAIVQERAATKKEEESAQ